MRVKTIAFLCWTALCRRRLAPKCRLQYLLCEPLCVLQALCERLNESVAAGLTQATVVPTFLTGLGQQSHPNLGYGVTAGLLPKHTPKAQVKHAAFIKMTPGISVTPCFTSWSWRWIGRPVFQGNARTRFRSHPAAARSPSGPAAAGSSAPAAGQIPSAGPQAGNASLKGIA